MYLQTTNFSITEAPSNFNPENKSGTRAAIEINAAIHTTHEICINISLCNHNLITQFN